MPEKLQSSFWAQFAESKFGPNKKLIVSDSGDKVRITKMTIIIKKENIAPLIKDLQRKYDVYAPVRKGDLYLFEEIKGKKKIELDYSTTILPPKNIFFPTRHTLMNFNKNRVKIPKFRRRILLFGIHPYDAQALLILDGIFTDDPHYSERRKNSIIVTVNDKRTPNAFYTELDHNYNRATDLFLEDTGDFYIATPKTKFGREILNSKFFEERKINTNNKASGKSGSKLLNLGGIKSSIEKGADRKIWAEIAEKCLGCGICSYVCPVCHCFDIEDKINLDKVSGCRCRIHDSCMLYEFSLILGRINFREKLQDRIHNWYHHKFVRAPLERGVVDCVGCGRCITFCPAGIDIKGILNRLQSGTG